nr:zf-CCHC domain-containing protein/DUF4219 domain-containing protein/UBN2 domain-containing protein [Tanacetum cinerariifolium]
MMNKQIAKRTNQLLPRINKVDEYSEDDEEVCVITSMKRESGSGEGTGKGIPKKPRHKCPMDMFFGRKHEDVLFDRKHGRQQTINEVCIEELRLHAFRELAKWFYDAGIPFKEANNDSFQIAMEAVAQFECNTLYQMLYKMVDEVGEDNVIQVVTHNATNYVKADATRPNLYWTPCAAHRIELMLEDIKKLERVKSSLKKAMFLNGYIYNHVGLVNMIRRAMVTAIEESKDLSSLALDELIDNLKFFRRNGKFVRQPREEKKSFRQRDEKKGKSDRKCFRCGDPNHLIGSCPKLSRNKEQKAFIGGSWNDSKNDAEDKNNNETCLMAQSSNEVCLRTWLEPDEWIKDSSFSKHMTDNKSLFSILKHKMEVMLFLEVT